MLTVVLSEPREGQVPPLGQALEAADGVAVVGYAQDGVEAAQLALRLRPDVLLADETLAGLGGLQVCRFVSQAAPSVACVLLAAHADLPSVREAMNHGARAVLTPDTPGEEALRVLRRVSAAAQVKDRPEYARLTDPSRMPSTLVILSSKGGCGTSFITANLAAMLAQTAPEETVLVDWHLQTGDLTSLLGLRPRHALADFAAYGEQVDAEVIRAALLRHEAGFFVLPGAVAPDRAWVQPLTRVFAAQLLGVLRTQFRYLVFDLNGPLATAELYLCRHAQSLLLVTDLTDNGALRGAAFLHGLLRAQGVAAERLRLVANRFRGSERAELAEVVRATGMQVAAEIPEDPAVAKASRAGELLLKSTQRGPAAAALQELLNSTLATLAPAPQSGQSEAA